MSIGLIWRNVVWFNPTRAIAGRGRHELTAMAPVNRRLSADKVTRSERESERERRPSRLASEPVATYRRDAMRTLPPAPLSPVHTTGRTHGQCVSSFTGRSGRVVSASDCGVRGPGFESHRGRLCLSRQLLRYAALGTGCAPLLQCSGQLSLAFLPGR